MLQPLDEDLAKQFKIEGDKGALVGDVPDGSSGARPAGIQSGDVVVAVDGKQVEGASELSSWSPRNRRGLKVDVKLLRDGKEQSVKVKLGERPAKNEVAKTEPAEP